MLPDEKIVVAIEKLGQVFNARIREMGRHHQLTPLQIQIIHYHETRPEHSCTVSQVAREFSLTKPTVSEAIRTLVTKKILERNEWEGDRRVFVFTLTPHGMQIAGELSAWKDVFLDQLKSFPSYVKKPCAAFLIQFIESLLTEGIIPLARICTTCSNFKKNSFLNSEKPHKCLFTNEPLSEKDLNINCTHHLQKTE